MDEPLDASEEPEPIMVAESEQDELVEAILDAHVGLREADTRKYGLTQFVTIEYACTVNCHPAQLA